MFKKLVAIEPVSLVEEAEKELHQYAEESSCTTACRRMMMKLSGESETRMASCSAIHQKSTAMYLNIVPLSVMWACAAACIPKRAPMWTSPGRRSTALP